MSRITGKVVAITGASSGIGEATARLLAAQGARVVVGARRNERLEALVADITASGGNARLHTVDVRSRDDVAGFIAFAEQAFGPVDVLVNNAGVMPLSLMAELKTDEWERMVDVNIRGVLNGIAAVLPGMKARRRGHIVNVASIGAHVVFPMGAVYCATKYAVWAISEGLRQESPELRVTTVSPGVVATELGHDISDASVRDSLSEWRKTSLSPDAIARAIAYAVAEADEVDVNELIVRPTASAF
ncbi:SDR family oxidoreductase [Xanthobacteraceae bacterium Astr-EGSB]|uniref:SDR family oxidoreductase n=1 Tax=Astrobacterium formosum TaxID=3069710 RepID=UPI0027B31636|nr:SDR family oxidoreductase [Xanthobacteraceae bacterium Astr-EGSB]